MRLTPSSSSRHDRRDTGDLSGPPRRGLTYQQSPRRAARRIAAPVPQFLTYRHLREHRLDEAAACSAMRRPQQLGQKPALAGEGQNAFGGAVGAARLIGAPSRSAQGSGAGITRAFGSSAAGQPPRASASARSDQDGMPSSRNIASAMARCWSRPRGSPRRRQSAPRARCIEPPGGACPALPRARGPRDGADRLPTRPRRRPPQRSRPGCNGHGPRSRARIARATARALARRPLTPRPFAAP